LGEIEVLKANELLESAQGRIKNLNSEEIFLVHNLFKGMYGIKY